MTFYYIFALAAVPLLLPLTKIFRKKALNVFDIMLMFAFLYFWAIPVQDFWLNHVRPEYIGRADTAWAVCIYLWALMGCSWLIKGYRLLNITNLMERFHVVKVKNGFHLFAFLYILYVFVNITNYSGENAEANNNFQYGLDVGFLNRVLALAYQPFFPALVMILYRNRPADGFYRFLRKVNLVLALVTLLLGAKTFMFFNLVLFLSYFYALNRKRLRTKHILVAVGSLVVFFGVIFPLSQSFRLYKQAMFGQTDHSFTAVATGFITSKDTRESLGEKALDYQDTRSLNVYDVLDWAVCRANYRGEGKLTGIVLSYLKPQRMRADNNIMADMMMGKGSDIGESVLAWYVLDWGVIAGPLVAVLHSLIFFIIVLKFGLFFNRFIRSSVWPLVIYSYMLRYAINIEHCPATDIKMFYNTYYLVILFLSVVLLFFASKHKFEAQTTRRTF